MTNCANRVAKTLSHAPSAYVTYRVAQSACVLSDELRGVLVRKWSMERPLCLKASIPQAAPDIKGTLNVRSCIKQRLLEWDKEKIKCLPQAPFQALRLT